MWVPRYVQDNQSYSTSSYTEYYNWIIGSTEYKYQRPGAGFPARVNVLSSVNFGGDLGTRNNIVVLSHFWMTGTEDDNNKEMYYYDQQYGFVKWAWIENGVETSSSVFNMIANGNFGETGRWPADFDGYQQC